MTNPQIQNGQPSTSDANQVILRPQSNDKRPNHLALSNEWL